MIQVGDKLSTAENELNEKNIFRIYKGEELMAMEFPEKDWLVEGLIRRSDSVLLVGDAKSGKSLLTQSLICSLSNGGVFLEKYICPASNKVCYVQVEGELADTQSRIKRLSSETPINLDNFFCYFARPLELQDTQKAFVFMEEIFLNCGKPDVLILDCLYQSFRGDLSDNKCIRELIGNLRIIKAFFGCTIIVLHHMRKPSMDTEGKLIDTGDDATFGSAFLKAWPDHILLLKHQKNSDIRRLTCTTQRSGEIEASVDLILVQPDPLYWKTVGEMKGIVYDKARASILSFLKAKSTKSAHYKEIIEETGIPKSTFYAVEKQLRKEGRIIKDGSGKTTIYRIFEQNEPKS